MDACEAVEKELQRVISKFNAVQDHSKRLLGDVTKNFEELKSSIAEGKKYCCFCLSVIDLKNETFLIEQLSYL